MQPVKNLECHAQQVVNAVIHGDVLREEESSLGFQVRRNVVEKDQESRNPVIKTVEQ